MKLTVDYSMTLGQAIFAGNYYYEGVTEVKGSRITHKFAPYNFPVPSEMTGVKEVRAKIFYIANSDEKTRMEMEKAGYIPANIREFLALGEQFPELQKKFRIVTRSTDKHLMSCLDAYGEERQLRSAPFSRKGCYYLGVQQ